MIYYIGIDANISSHAHLLYSIPSVSAQEKFYDELEKCCKEALASKYGEDKLTKRQLDTELEYARITGSSIDHLIQREVAAFARKKGGMAVDFTSGSLINYLLGASTTNPLPPHYWCESCRKIEYNNSVRDGYDLPQQNCPICGKPMDRDGHNLSARLFWSDTCTSLKYPYFTMRTSELPLDELQNVLARTLQADGGEERIFREVSLTFDKRCDSLTLLAEKTGIQVEIVPVENDGSFHDHVRREAYIHASFSGTASSDDLSNADFYITKEEIYRVLLELNFSPDRAALLTHKIAWNDLDALAKVPETCRGNMPAMLNVWQEAPCVSYVIWNLKLKWYEHHYPTQYQEICDSKNY